MADTGTDKGKIIVQLRALLLLTNTEVQIARVRVAQASTDAVRRELTENAQKGVERVELLTQALREVGGIPDVITPVLGRVTAVVKSTVEQATPIEEALLQDLALEHQLLDRARYLKVLVGVAELPRLTEVADRLITAHSATVEWLTVVLAEEALGGPSALRATPLQRVVGGATRVANSPARYAAETVNRTVNGVAHNTQQARQKLSAAADKATQFTGVVRDVFTVGRNASMQRAEKLANREGRQDTARAVHETRRDRGALSASELPIKNYDTLGVNDAAKAVKGLSKVEDVRAVFAYETAHAARSGVLNATQTQLAALAKDTVDVPR